MGKSDDDRARQQNYENNQRADDFWRSTGEPIVDDRNYYSGQDRQTRANAEGLYTEAGQTGFVNPEYVNRSRNYVDEGLGNLRAGGGAATSISSGGGPAGPAGQSGFGIKDYFKGAENVWRDLASRNVDVDMNALRSNLPQLQELAASGGYDPAALSDINTNIGVLSDIGQTGGIDAEGQNRMRGAGGFDWFAETGGMSPDEIANFRARSNSVIPAMYQNRQAELERGKNLSGGISPGYQASVARLDRDFSQRMGEASRDTEGALADRLREGRQWGYENIAASETALQQALVGAKLSGAASAAEIQTAVQQNLTQNRLQAIAEANQAEQEAQQLRLEAEQLEIGARAAAGSGMTEIGGMRTQRDLEVARMKQAAAEAAAARAAAASRAAAANELALLRMEQEYRGMGVQNEQYWGNLEQTGRFQGAGGLGNLYATPPGATSAMNDDAIQAGQVWMAPGMQSSQNFGQLYASTPNTFSDIMGGIGSVGGAVAPWLGGGGGGGA